MLVECEALVLEDVKLNSRTKPLVIGCEVAAGAVRERVTLIVKCLGLPEITPDALYCELLGNLLAREFGIETPEPFLVRITDDFVSATEIFLSERGLKILPGYGVGCSYFRDGFTPVTPDTLIPAEQLEAIATIYLCDLLCQNPDRRVSNPNCAIKGDSLVAYDFEKSLSFIYPIIGAPAAWEVSKLTRSAPEPHVFTAALRARAEELRWQPLLDKLKPIDNRKIIELCSSFPDSFGDHTDEVCEHFKLLAENAKTLEFELQRSLL